MPSFLLDKVMVSSKEHGRIVFDRIQKKTRAADLLSIEAMDRFGIIQFHEIKRDWFSHYMLSEDMTLTTFLDMPYTGIAVIYENTVDYLQDGVSAGTLEPFQCSLISLPYIHNVTKLYQQIPYSFSGIFAPPDVLEDYQKDFPSLSKFLTKVTHNIPVFENMEVNNESGGIVGMFSQIRKNAFEEAEGSSQTERNLDQLLRLILKQHEDVSQKFTLHESDINKLYEVREYLIQNPGAQLSLKQLSLQAGINEFKLKSGFKKMFGIPVFEFFIEERLKKAKELLMDKHRPINEIAALVGYKNLASFTAAFKKRFGYPPSTMR